MLQTEAEAGVGVAKAEAALGAIQKELEAERTKLRNREALLAEAEKRQTSLHKARKKALVAVADGDSGGEKRAEKARTDAVAARIAVEDEAEIVEHLTARVESLVAGEAGAVKAIERARWGVVMAKVLQGATRFDAVLKALVEEGNAQVAVMAEAEAIAARLGILRGSNGPGYVLELNLANAVKGALAQVPPLLRQIPSAAPFNRLAARTMVEQLRAFNSAVVGILDRAVAEGPAAPREVEEIDEDAIDGEAAEAEAAVA